MSRFTFTGRLVQGDALKPGPQRKDRKTGALKFRKDGQPDAPFFMAVAVPKDPSQRLIIPGNPSYEEVKALMDGDARAVWPNAFSGQRAPTFYFPASLAADCTSPKFANKILDGDGYDEDGKPNSTKDGFAGHWVIKVSNGFAPSVWEWLDNFQMPNGQIKTGWIDVAVSGRKIKCGDYVTISGESSSNESTERPGMYMNVDTVSFEQEGELIVSSGSVDPNAALGQRGGAASPPASAPPPAAPAASTGAPALGTGGSTTAPAYSGYRDPAAAAPPPPAPPAPPAGPVLTPAGQATGVTYAAYREAGWSDDQLRGAGYIA